MSGIGRLKAFADSLREQLRSRREEESDRVVKCPLCQRKVFYMLGRHSSLHILMHPSTPRFCPLDMRTVRAQTKEQALADFNHIAQNQTP